MQGLAVAAAGEVELVRDPGIGPGQPLFERHLRFPAQILADQVVVRVAPAHALRAGDVAHRQRLAGNAHHDPGKFVDRHHFLGSDVHRPRETRRSHQPQRRVEAFLHEEERSGLKTVAPDIDLAAIRRLGDLAADRGGRLFAPAGPGAFWPEDVVIARDAAFHAMVAVVGEVDPFGEEFFPTVFAVGISGVGAVLARHRSGRISLVVFRIHAGGGAVEHAPDRTLVAGIHDVEVDRGRIVHDVGVVLTREDEARTAHVGGKLVDLVEAAVHDRPAVRLFPQIGDDEIVGFGFAILGELQVDSANP